MNLNTLYPNLYAEYRATGYSLGTVAQHAGVTEELMQAVFQQGEPLTPDEIIRLHGLFSDFGCRDYRISYLVSPKKSMLAARKNKTKCRMRELWKAIVEVEKLMENGAKLDFIQKRELKRAKKIVFSSLNLRQPVAYAEYYWGLSYLKDIVAQLRPKAPRGLCRHKESAPAAGTDRNASTNNHYHFTATGEKMQG